jgi:hypothetical protein
VKLVVLGHGIDQGDQKIAWLGLGAPVLQHTLSWQER